MDEIERIKGIVELIVNSKTYEKGKPRASIRLLEDLLKNTEFVGLYGVGEYIRKNAESFILFGITADEQYIYYNGEIVYFSY